MPVTFNHVFGMIQTAASKIGAAAPGVAEQIGTKLATARDVAADLADTQVRNLQGGLEAVGEKADDLRRRAEGYLTFDFVPDADRFLDTASAAAREGIAANLSGKPAEIAANVTTGAVDAGKVALGFWPSEGENKALQAVEFILGAMSGSGITNAKGANLQALVAAKVTEASTTRNVATLIKLGQSAARIQSLLLPNLAAKKGDVAAIARSLEWRLKNSDPAVSINFYLVDAWLTLEALYRPETAAPLLEKLKPLLAAKRPAWQKEKNWDALLAGNPAVNAVRNLAS